MNKAIFKAYDVRGIYPQEINEAIVKKSAQALVQFLSKRGPVNRIIVGADVRASSPALKEAFIEGVMAMGADAVDIGTISTDMLYFASAHLPCDGAVAISASHNPAEYNGMKMVRQGAIGISGDSGLNEIRDIVFSDRELTSATNLGKREKADVLAAYLEHVLSFIDHSSMAEVLAKRSAPYRILTNANFGIAGKVATKLLADLPNIEQIELNCEPDGSFPLGPPNPMLAQNRVQIKQEIERHKPDLAVAWDADADRVFFYTRSGEAIEGYYITSLLAQTLLRNHKGAKIIHDPRLVWANEEAIKEAGGIPLVNKTGHMFIKERMRAEEALFAGEMSAHYYFKDNFYADNGMIPFLMVLSECLAQGKSVEELVAKWTSKFFTCGEINYRADDALQIIEALEQKYQAGKIERIDGLSISFDDWRFNLRTSNTEPLLRLNLESRQSEAHMQSKLAELEAQITGFGAVRK